MPIYEFRCVKVECPDCDKPFEVIMPRHRAENGPTPVCRSCGKSTVLIDSVPSPFQWG